MALYAPPARPFHHHLCRARGTVPGRVAGGAVFLAGRNLLSMLGAHHVRERVGHDMPSDGSRVREGVGRGGVRAVLGVVRTKRAGDGGGTIFPGAAEADSIGTAATACITASCGRYHVRCPVRRRRHPWPAGPAPAGACHHRGVLAAGHRHSIRARLLCHLHAAGLCWYHANHPCHRPAGLPRRWSIRSGRVCIADAGYRCRKGIPPVQQGCFSSAAGRPHRRRCQHPLCHCAGRLWYVLDCGRGGGCGRQYFCAGWRVEADGVQHAAVEHGVSAGGVDGCGGGAGKQLGFTGVQGCGNRNAAGAAVAVDLPGSVDGAETDYRGAAGVSKGLAGAG